MSSMGQTVSEFVYGPQPPKPPPLKGHPTGLKRTSDNLIIIKMGMIGDSGVGKTSIVERITENRFCSNYVCTIGVDFRVLRSEPYKIQLWDTAGAERFRRITPSFYRGMAVVLLVFDISNRETFNSITQWTAEIRAHARPNHEILLIGNKTDLVDKRAVTTEEAEKYAFDNEMMYIEVSAKSDDNKVINSKILEVINKYMSKVDFKG